MRHGLNPSSDNRLRLKDDLEFYARNCLRIRTKAGGVEAFHFNRAQQHIHERLELQKAKTGKVRALILKGRQQGCSTYVAARYYHRTTHAFGFKTFILTHEDQATQNLFDMVNRYHENCPEPVRPSTGAANAKELLFDKLDSGYKVGTAGTKGVGRSSTIQLFHGSEVAFWPHAETHAAGVLQAIPDEPDTEVILESTANGLGNLFHQRWREAEDGESDYIAIFVPWYWQEEYTKEVPADFALDEDEAEYRATYGLSLGQMAWRRAKIKELGDPVLFKQEYPATSAEAFQTSGHDSYIPTEVVAKARKATLDGIGPMIIGVDPKREGKDRFAIAWRRGRKLEKVWSDPAVIDNVRAAGMIKAIIDKDEPARVFIDAGGGGGIYDILVGWGEKYANVCRLINFGSAPIMPPKFDKDGKQMAGPIDRRTEMWSLSREWLEDEGGADIPDLDSLHTDACAPGYSYHPTSAKLVLESKRHMKAVRRVKSTDEWDAVVLTFAEPVAPVKRKAPIVHFASEFSH
jgi:hypothetical protein